MAFSPDGPPLASAGASADGTVQSWNTATPRGHFPMHFPTVTSREVVEVQATERVGDHVRGAIV